MSDTPPSDAERLAGLTAIWWQAIDDFSTLVEAVPH